MSETGCAAGDIGAKFAWDTKALGKHFSIAPVSGFLAPGQVCKLSVKLQPQHEAPDLRADGVKCAVQGLKEPLTLTLTGSAVADSAVAGTLKFACAVRGTAAQAVSVQNSSPATWQLKPVVQNAFWSGAETLKVPPNGTAEYKVEYRPLTMAEADKPHAGSSVLSAARWLRPTVQAGGRCWAAWPCRHCQAVRSLLLWLVPTSAVTT